MQVLTTWDKILLLTALKMYKGIEVDVKFSGIGSILRPQRPEEKAYTEELCASISMNYHSYSFSVLKTKTLMTVKHPLTLLMPGLARGRL